jgi:MYXO-CTERM domain-containing protein
MSDQALVGSPNQGDPGMVHRGAAYRFNRGPDDGNPWDDWQKLVHPAATGEDYLGISVALAADLGVVGTSPTAFIGKAGAAYLFHPDPNSQGTWIADEQPLPASNVDKLDRFGQSVAVWQNAAQGALGTTIFVGAPWQHRSGESLLGAVYAFAERRDLGDPCETPAQCQSGQCVTGTCCDSACASGRCPDGQCVVLAANGTSCTSGDECQSGFCTDGVCCTQASCLPFRCTEEGACPFACQSGHDCAPGYQCSSTHECKPTAAEADDTGCACGLTGAPRRPWGPSALALAAALFGRRRRRPSSPRRTRVSS